MHWLTDNVKCLSKMLDYQALKPTLIVSFTFYLIADGTFVNVGVRDI